MSHHSPLPFPSYPVLIGRTDGVSDTAIHELYAKTSGGRFVVAKKSTNGVGELYLQVGRKDASLTDAERKSHSISPNSLLVSG